MICGFSAESLALYIEDDLSGSEAEKVQRHLMECTECREFYQQLERSQSLLRSLRREIASPEAAAEVRRDVLSQIGSVQDALGWLVRIERFFWLGFRKHRYAFAGFGILAIVSVSLLGQMRQRDIEGQTLLRPDYRSWIMVASTSEPGAPDVHNAMATAHKVYVEPNAYRTYSQTGKFPEGTVVILELVSNGAERESVSVEASVKDSRFDGGWGYFGFTDNSGKLKTRAQALSDASGCRGCHEEHGGADHVFTPIDHSFRSSTAS